MLNDIKIIKKEVNYFLLINFGLIAFVSIFIFLCASKPNSNIFIGNFAGLFMYIPALSAIVVLKAICKYEFTPNVEKFLKVFAIATILRIIISIVEAFFIKDILISALLDTLVSLYLLYITLSNKSEFEVLNLSLTKNFKTVLFVVLIFVLIKLVGGIPDFLSMQIESGYIGKNIIMILISLVSNFFIGFSLFFGEEFGWRYFLQPRLQKLYGKKIGVLICGSIWGIWHLPLCITLYSPKTPIYCIINHLAYCILLGIFLGYTYMKTKNLWAPILIHLVNNVIAIVLGGGFEAVFTLQLLLESIIYSMIFFLPFLFTKEYKKNSDDEKLSTDI
ncbi:membrane spanning protein [[Clostridium] sordellii]|uniref:CPBP family intramembrane glutamic endopeptidase n=1 Tax=Paraclostridium sordellii TaxID=1505 RepID=UPI0005EA3775|nr:type II CAAX endopeptidase family protein [Paeniclostridium sordellii]MBX9179470.1 CPBP family intramembrane metalloprotease [Paeniclostridium sordellii]CEO12510.1 membrane spanning protein [[Clostridium] sordellii] [Paeniclostridium sordellii]CEP83511.1 membrane spanning protein [[Clostridium] sordellii] [Paeniclostridium sordellii]CEQ29729.1 membrane spanning protein [[Clostridium] sordellii] [Paeniclostridium sordellii]